MIDYSLRSKVRLYSVKFSRILFSRLLALIFLLILCKESQPPSFSKTESFSGFQCIFEIPLSVNVEFTMMKKILFRTFCLLACLCFFTATYSQSYTLGWQGNPIIDKSTFLNPSDWITGSSTGESLYVTSDTGAINLHWKFGTGNRFKYALCFQHLSNAVAITDFDLIGIDVKGSVCNSNRHFTLKFEDGTSQAIYSWQSLASINRWCERLCILKSQFSGTIDWNHVVVVTLVVSADASATDLSADTGVVSVKNLQISDIRNWQRASHLETLTDTVLLDSVKNHALQGILGRQVANGLLYSWKEDHSSWLYGHGLVLKILSMEGTWQNKIPSNDCAVAAEKLAMFLINHQESAGYWPRAWNTDDGSIKFIDETIWMGDFPWIITGLVDYYAKSGDDRVLPAIQKARSFLYSLIEPTGQFFTLNRLTGSKEPVTSVEAYSAAINAVFELGDSLKAMSMISHISGLTWDGNLLYWKEAVGSSRPVLFANTWMSMLMYHSGDSARAIDALSFVGKALDTHGPGKPEGFDGIGPVATWYEGTLTYICAGGPFSQSLYDSLVNYRYPDGTIPAYNDTIGGKAGIWAMNWSSLDATSWLYFASARKSPFKQYYQVAIPVLVSQITGAKTFTVYPNPARNILYLSFHDKTKPLKSVSLYNMNGSCIKTILPVAQNDHLSIDISSCPSGTYILVVEFKDSRQFGKLEIIR